MLQSRMIMKWFSFWKRFRTKHIKTMSHTYYQNNNKDRRPSVMNTVHLSLSLPVETHTHTRAHGHTRQPQSVTGKFPEASPTAAGRLPEAAPTAAGRGSQGLLRRRGGCRYQGLLRRRLARRSQILLGVLARWWWLCDPLSLSELGVAQATCNHITKTEFVNLNQLWTEPQLLCFLWRFTKPTISTSTLRWQVYT